MSPMVGFLDALILTHGVEVVRVDMRVKEGEGEEEEEEREKKEEGKQRMALWKQLAQKFTIRNSPSLSPLLLKGCISHTHTQFHTHTHTHTQWRCAGTKQTQGGDVSEEDGLKGDERGRWIVRCVRYVSILFVCPLERQQRQQRLTVSRSPCAHGAVCSHHRRHVPRMSILYALSSLTHSLSHSRSLTPSLLPSKQPTNSPL